MLMSAQIVLHCIPVVEDCTLKEKQLAIITGQRKSTEITRTLIVCSKDKALTQNSKG